MPKEIADGLRIVIDVAGFNQPVMVNCEPGDLEKVWARKTPSVFLCASGTQYTFSVPVKIGYATFKWWRHPKTGDTLGSSPTLVITPSKKNERYVAVYEEVLPMDAYFEATTPKEEVTIIASVPDINGRVEIKTPGRLTYLCGTVVSFTCPKQFTLRHPDVLYEEIQQVHTLLRWEQDAVTLGKEPKLRVTMDVPRNLRVLYGRSPVPRTPNEQTVRVLGRQVFRAIDQLNTEKGVVILANGKLLSLFGRFTFPNEKSARSALQTAVLQTVPNWTAQAPEAWRDWLKVESQRGKFLEHWFKNAVQILPLNKLNFEVSETPKS